MGKGKQKRKPFGMNSSLADATKIINFREEENNGKSHDV